MYWHVKSVQAFWAAHAKSPNGQIYYSTVLLKVTPCPLSPCATHGG